MRNPSKQTSDQCFLFHPANIRNKKWPAADLQFKNEIDCLEAATGGEHCSLEKTFFSVFQEEKKIADLRYKHLPSRTYGNTVHK